MAIDISPKQTREALGLLKHWLDLQFRKAGLPPPEPTSYSADEAQESSRQVVTTWEEFALWQASVEEDLEELANKILNLEDWRRDYENSLVAAGFKSQWQERGSPRTTDSPTPDSPSAAAEPTGPTTPASSPSDLPTTTFRVVRKCVCASLRLKTWSGGPTDVVLRCEWCGAWWATVEIVAPAAPPT